MHLHQWRDKIEKSGEKIEKKNKQKKTALFIFLCIAQNFYCLFPWCVVREGSNDLTWKCTTCTTILFFFFFEQKKKGGKSQQERGEWGITQGLDAPEGESAHLEIFFCFSS